MSEIREAGLNGDSDISTSLKTADMESARSLSARYVMLYVVFHTAPCALCHLARCHCAPLQSSGMKYITMAAMRIIRYVTP